MRVLAIDPGSEQSAWLLLVDSRLALFAKDDNETVREMLVGAAFHRKIGTLNSEVLVIEQIESYGMAVGREVFETVRWAGRFEEAAQPLPVVLLPRRAVKLHLCGSAKAKDSNIRQALIDRFGGPASIRKGGALYGVSKDVWSALAIAVTYADSVA